MLFGSKKEVINPAPESKISPESSSVETQYKKPHLLSLAGLTTPLFGPYRELFKKESKKLTTEEVREKEQRESRVSSIPGALSYATQVLKETPGLVAAQIASSFIESGSKILSLYYGSKVLSLLEALNHGVVPKTGDVDPTTALIQNVGMAAIAGIIGFYEPLRSYISSKIDAQAEIATDKNILNAISVYALNELEGKNLCDDITVVRENSWRISTFTSYLMYTGIRCTETAAMGGVVFITAVDLVGAPAAFMAFSALIATAVPQLFSDYRHAKATVSMEKDLADLRRKNSYLHHAVGSPELVRELKTFDKEKQLQDRTIAGDRHIANTRLNWEKKDLYQNYYTMAVSKTTFLATVGYFFLQTYSGALDPSQFLFVSGAIYSYNNALSLFGHNIGHLVKHLPFVQRTAGLIEDSKLNSLTKRYIEVEHLNFNDGPIPIELKDVSFTYTSNKHRAIDAVSLRIEPGEYVAIVGPNGGGKTTLTKIIKGIYPPLSGEVLYDGTNIEFVSKSEVSSWTSIAGQNGNILYGLNVQENIELGSPGKRNGMPMEEAVELGLVSTFVADLSKGLKTFYGNGLLDGQDFSTGQIQMILAARGFHRLPRLFILDEPTSNLDVNAAKQLYKNLKEFAKQGVTIVQITHDLEDAERWADRIIVVEGGKIVAQGQGEELRASCEWYRNAFANLKS